MHNIGNYQQGEKTAFRMGEKIANEATHKELISKIYKQLLQLNAKEINDPIKKTGQRTKKTFLQRRHTDG